MQQTLSISFDDTQVAFAYKSDAELRKAQFLFKCLGYPWLVRSLAFAAPWAVRWHLPVRGLIRRTVFEQFCGGETLQEAGATARKLANYQVGVILDYGVEAKEGEDNYDHAVPEFQQAIRYAASQPNIPFISLKVTGFARVSLLEKLQRKEALSLAEQQEFERVRRRVTDICQTAWQSGVSVSIDAEQSWIQDPVDLLTEEVMERFNRSRAVVFNTYQMYRWDRLEFLKASYRRCREKGCILGAKLVRGAYMEKERERAARLGYASPVQPDKASTDRDYDAAIRFACEHLDTMALFVGTHNQDSCLLAARLLHESGAFHQHPHMHFSQLYGMSDTLTFNLAKAGYRVSKYLPYGPVTDVLPYLIRRAEENSSVSGQMSRELRLIHQEILRRSASKNS